MIYNKCSHNGSKTIVCLLCGFLYEYLGFLPGRNEKGFFPLLILLCLFRLLDWEKDLLHEVQEKGFPPELLLLCLFKSLY